MTSERLRDAFRSSPVGMAGDAYDFRSEALRDAVARDISGNRENALKNFFKRWPRFYDRLALIVAPILFTGLTSEEFLADFSAESSVLNVGSGSLRLHTNAVNLDVIPFVNVDVLAPAEALPFRDGVFDAAVCDQVLEHVADPYRAAQEIVRVLKPGGQAYVGVPFIYPLHPSPSDYARWSVEGLEGLFPGMEIVSRGQAMGPTSGLLVVLAEWVSLACSFGIPSLRTAMRYLVMLVLFPFKYLDVLFSRFPGSETLAASVYVVVRRPS